MDVTIQVPGDWTNLFQNVLITPKKIGPILADHLCRYSLICLHRSMALIGSHADMPGDEQIFNPLNQVVQNQAL